MTVSMKFINDTSHDVQLRFCSFSISGRITTDVLQFNNFYFLHYLFIYLDPGNLISNTTTPSKCTSETSTYIYLLDQDSNFFQFHPITFVLTFIARINCSNTA